MVTGSIDTRTVAALGVSNKICATQGEPTTVGQVLSLKIPVSLTRRPIRTRPPARLGRTDLPHAARLSTTNRRCRVRPPDRLLPTAAISLAPTRTCSLDKPTRTVSACFDVGPAGSETTGPINTPSASPAPLAGSFLPASSERVAAL
jgi:hypothetical protein